MADNIGNEGLTPNADSQNEENVFSNSDNLKK